MNHWFQRGTQLINQSKIKKLLTANEHWQLYSTNSDGYALCADSILFNHWCADSFPVNNLFKNIQRYWVLVIDNTSTISSLESGPYLGTYNDCELFAKTYKKVLEKYHNTNFTNGIYIEKYSLILPTYPLENDDSKIIFGRYLSAGVNVSTDEYSKLCKFMSWLHPQLVADLIKIAGYAEVDANTISLVDNERIESKEDSGLVNDRKRRNHKSGDRFVLPGRPELEDFFNEQIVDIILNQEKYKRVGIGFPSATVLYGEPGCGKTFAVGKLIDFLGWPSYHMDSGSIGSPYIHDTSKKISEIFDAAISNSPSVVVIDEMEAFLTDRGVAQSSGQHHIEEVAEFLRKIPEAQEKNVLVIAMTNMIESIDKAILRRGRFDHIFEVKMPTKEEIKSLLDVEISKLPVSKNIDILCVAEELAGRPMSDITYVLKEAGRQAVKQNSEIITQSMIMSACNSLPNKKSDKHAIGFSVED